MSLMLSEKEFGKYLNKNANGHHFELGKSLISVNIVHATPVMSCLYLGESFFFAARYNQQYGVFTDPLLIEKQQIVSTVLHTKLMNAELQVQTNLPIAKNSKDCLELKMNISKLTPVKWHKENLKNLSQRKEFVEKS